MSTYRLTPDLVAALSGEMEPVHVGPDYVNFEIAGRIHTFPLGVVEAIGPPIPDEPDGGAWMVGDRIMVRDPDDTDADHWRIYPMTQIEGRDRICVTWAQGCTLGDPVPLLTAEAHMAALLADAPDVAGRFEDEGGDPLVIVRSGSDELLITARRDGLQFDRDRVRRLALALLKWSES